MPGCASGRPVAVTDLDISMDDAACESLPLSAQWSSLEEAGAQTTRRHFPAMAELGKLLGDALFPQDSAVTDSFIKELAAAQRDSRTLRLRFVGEAARLPVEFATLPDAVLQRCRQAGVAIDDAAIALHNAIEVSRNVEGSTLAASSIEATRQQPLRMLIAVANPATGNWPNIPRAEPQAKIIESACRGIAGDYVEVTYLVAASPTTLAAALKDTRPHILHYVGHGAAVSADVKEPALVLAADHGRDVAYLSAPELLDQFSELPQFVSLNACHLGGSDPSLPGFAESLSNAGVPVVLAMQLPVADTVAEHIAEGVYRPLLRGLPVSRAVANLRRQLAIDSRLRHHPQWATPVIFSRVANTSRFSGIPLTGMAEARSRSAARQFVGREWLWKAVRPCLEAPQDAVVLLEADAGLGKTSFLEHCLRELESGREPGDDALDSTPLVIVHRYRYGEQSDAAACARALSEQLLRWLEDNGKPLPEERPPDAAGSPYLRACTVLDDLLTAATSQTHVVLLIDALDEADDARDALPIADRLGRLPGNLSVFATARPEWYGQWRSGHPAESGTSNLADDDRFFAITLEPLSKANLRDVAYFIYQSFQPFGLAINQAGCLELARNVQGSLLVADILLGMLRTGDDENRTRDRFRQAESVTGAYDLVFRSLAADLAAEPQSERRLRDTEDLLAFIACARDPVTDEQLQTLFGKRSGSASDEGANDERAKDVADALRHLRRFLSSDLSEYGEQLYRPYHQSLRTYGERRLGMSQPSTSSEADPSLALRQALPRAAAEYRKIWADYCLRWKTLEQYPAVYALRHLVPHLIALEGDEPLEKIGSVLTDYGYIAAALGANPNSPERPLHVNELIAHYDSAERRRRNAG